jgi:hypothetical protein
VKIPAPLRRPLRIGLVLLAFAWGLGLVLWHTNNRHPRAKGLSTGTEVTRAQLPRRAATPADGSAEPKSPSALPPRPQASVLHRNLQRAGFQWIFRRLGATDAQLNWIADGQFSELIGDLRSSVESGDAKATAVLGWLAERCRLLRGAEQQTSWRQFNSARLQPLAAADLADYREVATRQDQWEQSFREACTSQIDQDYVDRHLEEMATKQDGASLWLLSRRSSNYAAGIRLMSEAASTGFAQAQYEFARSLIMDPDARKVVTQALSPVTLLTEAAATVPEAKVVLAQCLFEDCDLREPDHEAALQTAREAAGAGEPDAIFFLASRLSIGTLPADEVTAWRLFKSTLAAQGCYGDEDAAFGLEPPGSSGPTPLPSAAARSLAVTFWQRYGMQAVARLGCN